MRDLAEFANTISDLIDAGLQDVTDRIVETDIQPLLIAEQLLKSHTKLIGSAGVTVNFPRRHDVEASEYSEGDDVPGPLVGGAPGEIVYEFISVTPEEFGVSETITRAMIDSSDWDAVNDLRDALSEAMARKSDDRSWNGIVNATTVVGEVVAGVAVGWGTSTQTVVGTNNLANDRILEILSIVDTFNAITYTANAAVNGYTADYYLGAFNLTDLAGGAVIEVTYIYSDNTSTPEKDYDQLNFLNVATATEFSYTDLVRGKFRIIGRKGMPDVLTIDDFAGETLTLDQKFIDAGGVSDDTVRNGLLKVIGNMSVLMTTQLWPGVGITVKKLKIGYKVWKNRLSSREELIQAKPGDRRIMMWEKSEIGINHAELINITLNANPNAEFAPV